MGTIWAGSSQLPKRICHLRNSGDWHGLLSCLGFQKQMKTRATIDHHYSACNPVVCFGGEQAAVCLLNASAQFCFWCLLKLKTTQEHTPTHRKTTNQAGSLYLGLVCVHITVVPDTRRTEGWIFKIPDEKRRWRETPRNLSDLSGQTRDWTLSFLVALQKMFTAINQLAVKEGGGEQKWQIEYNLCNICMKVDTSYLLRSIFHNIL